MTSFVNHQSAIAYSEQISVCAYLLTELLDRNNINIACFLQ